MHLWLSKVRLTYIGWCPNIIKARGNFEFFTKKTVVVIGKIIRIDKN